MKHIFSAAIIPGATTALCSPALAKDCDKLSGNEMRRCLDNQAKAVMTAIDKKVYDVCIRKLGSGHGEIEQRLICRINMLQRIHDRASNFW